MLIGRLRSILSIADRLVPWLALVAAPVGIALVVRSQHGAVAALDWTLTWRTAAISTLAFAVAPLLQGVSFWVALRVVNAPAPAGDALLVWSRSYVVRYAPTGALSLAYRVSSRQRLNASVDQVLAAYAYEHVATLAAGAAVCIGLFAALGGLPPLPALAIAVAALAATAALHPRLAGRTADALARRLGCDLSITLGGRSLMALIAINVLGWLGTGAGVYALVSELAPDRPGFVWLVGSYTAGYLVGFVTPLAPGGLGAREGMLIVLLRGRYGTGAAAGISIAIRAINVAGEILAVTLVHIAYVVALLRRDVPALAPAEAP